ncbi:MAG: YeeE/YedE family protein [Cyclobacteriaceae bacterium]
MFFMLYNGKNFGVSANLRTACTIGGAGKFSEFFRFDWKSQSWNLIFVFGSITGGFIASSFLSSDEPMQVASSIVQELQSFGIANPGSEILPSELFSFEALMTVRGMVMLILGGFLVGFGARYAGGCTSGHAISGLSDLQLPSLIAVIGFFIGGLIMTFLLLPFILEL